MLKCLYLYILFASTLFSANSIRHIVQKGDSFLSIASQYYGDPQKWTCVLKSNPKFLESSELDAGDIINVDLSGKCEVKAAVSETKKQTQTVIDPPMIKLKKMPMLGKYTLQIASFPKRDLALKKKKSLEDEYLYEFDLQEARVRQKTWYRLRLGGFDSKNSAIEFAKQIKLQEKFVVMPL